LISISVCYILIERLNINQMFNLFVCITKMKHYLRLEHHFMLQVGVKQSEEHRLIDLKKRVFHLLVTVNVTVKKVIVDSLNRIV